MVKRVNHAKEKVKGMKTAKKIVTASKDNLNKVKKMSIKFKSLNPLKKAKRKEMRNAAWVKMCKHRGVVFLSCFPHGFYEKEMHNYFSQFGTVTAIRLPRSEKTGRSKGYAFIEFEYKEVAKVVAETMNNYMMFDQVLKAKYIPPEEQKPYLFHRAGFPWQDTTAKDAKDKRRKESSEIKNGYKDPRKFVKKTKQRLRKLREKIMNSGVNYEIQINDSTGILKDEPKETVKGSKKLKSEIKQKVEGDDEKLTEGNEELPVVEVDESDEEIQFKPPPNVIMKTLKSSKSKLKKVKNKTTKVIKNNADVIKKRTKKR